MAEDSAAEETVTDEPQGDSEVGDVQEDAQSDGRDRPRAVKPPRHAPVLERLGWAADNERGTVLSPIDVLQIVQQLMGMQEHIVRQQGGLQASEELYTDLYEQAKSLAVLTLAQDEAVFSLAELFLEEFGLGEDGEPVPLDELELTPDADLDPMAKYLEDDDVGGVPV